MATVTVTNPLYWRLAGTHPVTTRPFIPADPFLAVLEEWGTGAMTAAAANSIIQSQSAYADPSGNGSINVGLDTVEQQQANDLFSTVSGLGQAQQGSRLHKLHNVLYLLSMAGGTISGYGPDDMAGTLAAAGGKLSVVRRDQTYTG
jgi:hypothetical protein